MRTLLLLKEAIVGFPLFCALGLAACGGSTKSGGATGGGGNKIYVAVYGADAVDAFDVSSHAMTGSVALGAGRGPAILLKTPDGKKLYTANWKDNSLSAIDPAGLTAKNIPLAGRPYVIAMSPAGDVLYAGLNGGGIAVVSTADDTIMRTIDTKGALPESIIVSPDGATLYVSLVDESNPLNLLMGSITAISASTGAVVHPAVTVGEVPAWITITPDGKTLYTLNFLSGNISVIDTASWTVPTTIPLAGGSASEPIVGGVSSAGALVVTDFGTHDVAIVDTATNAVTHTFSTSGRPVGVDFSADGSVGYVTDFGASSLMASPSLAGLQSGNLDSSIGTGPSEIVVFDPAKGTPIGAPITVSGAGAISIVVVD